MLHFNQIIPIDKALIKISFEINKIKDQLPKRDSRILVSLARQLNSGLFLTENQGKLSVKIIKENLTSIKNVIPDIENILNQNIWSKNFRIFLKIRKIFLDTKNNELFHVQFSFNTKIKDKISKFGSKIDGTLIVNGNIYTFLLTEKNISIVIGNLKNEDFEIDEKIMNFYQEIKKIEKNQEKTFDIFSSTNEKLKKILQDEIGDISKDNILLLQDRKIKYQYTIAEKLPNLPLNNLASRTNRNVWVNPNKFSFEEIISFLLTLKRFPLMVIFDGYDNTEDLKNLKILEKSLKFHNLEKNIGIYFRYDNGLEICEFNKLISSLSYNSILDDQTNIVGLSNSKLPKFLIKNQWKPNSIISFTSRFKGNKIHTYTTDVDLIMYYVDQDPSFVKDYETL